VVRKRLGGVAVIKTRVGTYICLLASLAGCGEPADRMTGSIAAREVVVLGTDDGAGILGAPASVLRVASGDWLVMDYMLPGQPRLFESDGTPKWTIARSGAGPNEFDFVEWMALGPGDSVYFVDRGNSRLAVRSPTLRPGRTAPLYSFANGIVILPDGGLVTATRGRGGVDAPLVYLSADGTEQRGLGKIPAEPRSTNFFPWFRTLAESTDTSFWAAELTRHVVREWSVSGRLLNEIELDEPWFPPQEGFGANAEEEPRPSLMAIDLDEHGLLWLLTYTADPDWMDAAEDGKDPYGRSSKVIRDLSRYYDTVIEVVDPAEGEVIASLRMDQRLDRFAGHRLVYGETQSPAGSPTMTVWELSLDGGAR
jgi:hypothetical protein